MSGIGTEEAICIGGNTGDTFGVGVTNATLAGGFTGATLAGGLQGLGGGGRPGSGGGVIGRTLGGGGSTGSKPRSREPLRSGGRALVTGKGIGTFARRRW